MLTQEIVMEIYNCMAEINRAKQLLEKCDKFIEQHETGKKPEALVDSFGRCHNWLEMGIPSSPSSRSIVKVDPKLGKSVIEAHLILQELELEKLNDAAKVMLEVK